MRSEKEAVLDCLFNNKFATAETCASHIPKLFTEKQLNLIGVLSRQYGDAGWISGDQGAMIKLTLDKIGVFDDNTPELSVVNIETKRL